MAEQKHNSALSRRFAPNLAKWLVPAVTDWLVIALSIGVANWALFHSPSLWISIPVLFAALVTTATRQHALGLLGHDGAHRLVSRNRTLNDLLTSLLCFWPMGSNLGGYRRFHFDHHRNAGQEGDPEHIHTRNQFKILGIPVFGQWNVPIKRWKFVTLVCFDFLGGAIPHMGMAIYLTRPATLIDRIGPMLTLGSIGAVLWACNSLWILAFWYLSIGTAFWALFRLRIWTEHVNTNGTHVIKANWLEKFLFLPHNTNYHYEHHQHPSVPFWALPECRLHPEKAITVSELFDMHFSKDHTGESQSSPDETAPGEAKTDRSQELFENVA